ncbi:MAG: TetR/AcrR family transcriptional regulator [Gammaproteobacteria bacterium]
MARTKAFDTDQALQKAIETFWRYGYDGTSVQTLLDEMGINRGSLYATFGDKEQLFQSAIEQYRRSVVIPRLAELESEEGGLAAIRSFFAGLLERVRKGEARNGCLMTNTCVELGPHDRAIARKVRANLSRIEKAFCNALNVAQQQGELAPSTDTRKTARFLVATLQGLQVLSKAGLSADYLEDVVETALGNLA